jgi:hypothetical protein
LEKIRLLSEYLRALEPEQLRIAGHFPNRKAIRANRPADLANRMGDPLSRAARRERARQCRAARIASSYGDAGKATFEALEGRTTPEPFSLGEAQTLFEICTKRAAPWPRPSCSRLG